MVRLQSHRVTNKQGEEQFIDVFQKDLVLDRSTDPVPCASVLLKGRNGRRARKLDKGVYEIDGLRGLYRSKDPSAP